MHGLNKGQIAPFTMWKWELISQVIITALPRELNHREGFL